MAQFSEIRKNLFFPFKTRANNPHPFSIPRTFSFDVVDFKLEKIGLVQQANIGVSDENNPYIIGVVVE